MSGPVNLNQILSQTPAVEKVHQPAVERPEAAQRLDSLQEAADFRRRTESVQIADDSEAAQRASQEKKRQEERERRLRQTLAQPEPEPEPALETGAGSIVNVII